MFQMRYYMVRLFFSHALAVAFAGHAICGSGCNKPNSEAVNSSPALPIAQGRQLPAEVQNQQPANEQKKIVFPELGSPKQLEEGIDLYQLTLQREGHPMLVWVYVPKRTPGQKLPCVLIAPAGSPLVVGMKLGEGDRPEHLPYARAGFIVVSYEIDGHLDNRSNASEQKLIAAATAFKDAKAGVLNAKTALDFAMNKVPGVDPLRIYSAGHSSAATLSLLVASNDQRIKGCVAYAPVTDVEARIGKRAILELTGWIPGYDEFMKASSPLAQVAQLKCPVFLFHAKDDSNVPISESTRFVEELKQTNSQVTFAVVPHGDHYAPMISEGIPKAIEWLRKLRE